jgi:serine/threonine protein kinase
VYAEGRVLETGSRIDDRYEIIGPLGSGGMGHVYKARRLHLGDEVAIKVMQTAAPELRERFLRESRACAQLRHPNIVGILDFGFHQSNQPYMVMELLSGPSLREEIAFEAPMTSARVAAILGPVASALQLAHEHGITHRDLKPANIVVHRYGSGERVYKVIDFGLASVKAGSDDTRLTGPDLFLGTLAYAAPEQFRGEMVTPLTDIYALGLIAYEMLTGGAPFDSGNKLTVVNQALTMRPTNPNVRNPALSLAVDGAVMRALAKDPADRWPSAVEFTKALAETSLLARYELGPLLGRGRMASYIHRGTHRALGIDVAIRMLRRTETPNWEVVKARFLLEARTLQVAHPSVLQVRDFGEDERGVFLVTDYIDGPSLRELMSSQGAMAWPRVARLVGQALEAASVLHRRGGFVAGVNPDMIRIAVEGSHDRLVMSAAGIRSVQDVLATMREQELRGQEASEKELPYVAPEILMGRAPDARSDVFTIGVLAYQMATAQVPFRAPSLPELMGQMLTQKPVSPLSMKPDIPETASEAILKSLAGDPVARFQTAEEFRRAVASDEVPR